MSERSWLTPGRWCLIGVPALFLLGSLVHFLYLWTGESTFVGCFAPINESAWEHAKLSLLPLPIWWLVYRREQDRPCWYAGMLIALAVSFVAVPIGYFAYSGLLGAQAMWADLLLYAVALALGQWAGYGAYRRGLRVPLWAMIGLLIVLFVIVALASYFPPEIPLFYDTDGGFYGAPSSLSEA